MTDGILLVLMSSHFHCSDPSIPPRGPYVLYSSLKECRDGAWRNASALSNVMPNVAKHRLCHSPRWVCGPKKKKETNHNIALKCGDGLYLYGFFYAL